MELDYDKAIHLDAEALAEEGIADGYARILPELRHHVHAPIAVYDYVNSELPSYEVGAGPKRYRIYPSPRGGDEYESWGIATSALFSIVNEQLAHVQVKFYAINSGNDLSGMFLTLTEVESAKHSLPSKEDWPYLPIDVPPWFGQEH